MVMQEKPPSKVNLYNQYERRKLMIIKELEIPNYLEKLEALERRVPHNHEKYQVIVDSYSKWKAGYQGEKSLYYYLSFLSDKYLISHGLRLSNGTYFFQIDILLITHSFLLIVEVKNYSGILHFDPQFNQLIRTYNGKEEALPDPLTQVERQKFQLMSLMHKRNIPSIPIETLVVMSNPKAVLKAPIHQTQISKKVIHATNFSKRVKEYEQIHQHQILSDKEMKNISRFLVKKHQPLEKNIMQQFKISKKDLLTGVQCPECGEIPMKRNYGGWMCYNCDTLSGNAHIKALRDYAQLICPFICNEEARYFLHVSSESTAKRILTKLNIPNIGNTKGRKYDLSRLS
jgi:ssDNA-binding Zn-finger/Zn-ribbon topoisomerase 1